MNLKEKIENDLIGAIKDKRDLERDALRFLLGVIHNREIEKRGKIVKSQADLETKELEKLSRLTEEELIEVIQGEVKKGKEAKMEFEKAGRQDLAQKETRELEILKRYLPEPLSEAELKNLINEAIQEAEGKSPQDFGKVMKILMPKVKGRAEGGKVSQMVKEAL